MLGLKNINAKLLDDLLFYGVMGVILGGRLGEVLFYNPDYYFSHPLKILAVWEGGMSFHGGFLGVLIAMALFAAQAGIELNHVPYKGASDLATGLAGNQVPIAFQGLASVLPLVKARRLKLLAVGTPRRMPAYPDVPTVSESGLQGFEFNSWFTLMAPAGTPADIVARLNAEVLKALADPAVREQLNGHGLTPRGSSAEELATATRAQLARYAALIKKAGIKAE